MCTAECHMYSQMAPNKYSNKKTLTFPALIITLLNMNSVSTAGTHLPYVQNVTLLAADCIGVQDQVAVASVEVSVRLWLHRDQLQILNSPHLHTVKG